MKKILYRLTPRSESYSMTFSNDEFIMYKGLYNFQLYSLHELSILIYLGLNPIPRLGGDSVGYVPIFSSRFVNGYFQPLKNENFS